MKSGYIFVFVAVCFLSCKQAKQSGDDGGGSSPKTDNSEIAAPDVQNLNITDSIKLKANDDMRFDHELFRVKAGSKLILFLRNTGKKGIGSMAHNVVVLEKGTDLADFAELVRSAKNENYAPHVVDSLMIAHTKLINAGESTAVEFTIPQAGAYDFICSVPGHWGTMQGKIVAE